MTAPMGILLLFLIVYGANAVIRDLWLTYRNARIAWARAAITDYVARCSRILTERVKAGSYGTAPDSIPGCEDPAQFFAWIENVKSKATEDATNLMNALPPPWQIIAKPWVTDFKQLIRDDTTRAIVYGVDGIRHESGFRVFRALKKENQHHDR